MQALGTRAPFAVGGGEMWGQGHWWGWVHMHTESTLENAKGKADTMVSGRNKDKLFPPKPGRGSSRAQEAPLMLGRLDCARRAPVKDKILH